MTPFADPQALADAAMRMLVDGDLHARLSVAARARVVELFSMERVLAMYTALYGRVLR
jgi:glycosyltransferase involved in cell wall biosynthesis